ncbi:MAG: 2,3,4,5-tetrahydropyridine-2,6-dicarboxylate N-acetyltransferase [bacterium ADurb.Bin270]|nr:MAG: 2,3,4,5-tetrahydropyridine-2,6-dicarboxylate N-acetyltransferase [bacterium ADurb.Bin270]
MIRADLNSIEIGSFTNIQDLSVLHVETSHPMKIGSHVSVGHRAILHGCTIEDKVLIGMGAIIMNGAKIGEGSVIGAGALVTENAVIPPRSLVIGFPGKIRRNVSDEELAQIESAAKSYAETAMGYFEA